MALLHHEYGGPDQIFGSTAYFQFYDCTLYFLSWDIYWGPILFFFSYFQFNKMYGKKILPVLFVWCVSESCPCVCFVKFCLTLIFWCYMAFNWSCPCIFLWGSLNSFVCLLQYPDYVDAYLRLAAIAKARNNVQLSIELVDKLSFPPCNITWFCLLLIIIFYITYKKNYNLLYIICIYFYVLLHFS